jgi:energy-coupling factor transporter ATP-binding protein EcfA2
MFALDKFTIRRFRGLQDLTLDDLGRVNLLVGPNDSGKTSILEAIAIFCHPLDLRVWLDATWRREALDPDDPFFLSVEWMFPHEPLVDGPFVRGRVSLAAAGRFPVRDLQAFYTPTSRIATKRVPPQEGSVGASQNGYEQAGARVDLHAIVQPHPTETISRRFDLWEGDTLQLSGQSLALPVRTVTPVSHRVEPIHKELSEATLAGQKRQILSLLKELDPRILDVQILSPKGRHPAIYIDYVSNGLLPMSAFGDGVRRAFLIALVLNSVAGGVLLIDEIESSLHVTALGSLFSWLVKSCEELDVQLFATTHSLEAVDAMIEAESKNLDRVVGYHLEAPNGVPQVQRLDGQLLHRLRYERGLDVRL